jgi:hypothetical protein
VKDKTEKLLEEIEKRFKRDPERIKELFDDLKQKQLVEFVINQNRRKNQKEIRRLKEKGYKVDKIIDEVVSLGGEDWEQVDEETFNKKAELLNRFLEDRGLKEFALNKEIASQIYKKKKGSRIGILSALFDLIFNPEKFKKEFLSPEKKKG